jgi:hypothetical protein
MDVEFVGDRAEAVGEELLDVVLERPLGQLPRGLVRGDAGPQKGVFALYEPRPITTDGFKEGRLVDGGHFGGILRRGMG